MMFLHARVIETIKFEPIHTKCKRYLISMNEAGSKYGTRFPCEGEKPDFSSQELRIKVTSHRLDVLLHLSEDINGNTKQIAFMRIPLASFPINKRARVKLTLYNFGMKSDPEFLFEFHFNTNGAQPFQAEKGVIDAKIFERSLERQNRSYKRYLAERKRKNVNNPSAKSSIKTQENQGEKTKQKTVKHSKSFEREFGISSSDEEVENDSILTPSAKIMPQTENKQVNFPKKLPEFQPPSTFQNNAMKLPQFNPVLPGFQAQPPPSFVAPTFQPPKDRKIFLTKIPSNPLELRSLDPEQPMVQPAPEIDSGIPKNFPQYFRNLPKNDYIQIEEPEESESEKSIDIPKELPEFQPENIFDLEHQYEQDPFKPPSLQPTPPIPFFQPPKYDLFHHENSEIRIPRKLPSYDILLTGEQQFTRFVQQK